MQHNTYDIYASPVSEVCQPRRKSIRNRYRFGILGLLDSTIKDIHTLTRYISNYWNLSLRRGTFNRKFQSYLRCSLSEIALFDQ
jgi:hypothetical protein